MAFALWLVLSASLGTITFLLFQRVIKSNTYGPAYAVSGVVTLLAVFSPFYYEYPDWPDTLYSIENGILVEKPWGTFEHGKELAWVTPKKFNAYSTVTPITANPKVRKISYRTEGWITDPQKYLANPERRVLWVGMVDGTNTPGTSIKEQIVELIRFCQYELNNAHSTELADFYNPLDQTQQTRFRTIVWGYLNQCLKPEGVAITVRKFDID